MKILRRAFFAVALLAACNITTQYPVMFAAGEEVGVYARAEITDAYFCSQPELTCALFAIPYTYCVKILGEEGAWYYVSYGDDYGNMREIYGYVLKNSVTELGYTPETPCLYLTITVTYSAGYSGNLPTLSDITTQAAFYGNYYSGGSGYSYVYCQGSFGYITGATEDYTLCEEAFESEEQSSSTKASGGKIVAFIALGVFIFLALALVISGGRRHRGGKGGA